MNTAVLFLLILLVSLPVSAAIIYEGFDYPVGSPLGGQTNPSNGQAWANTGTGTAGADEVLVSTGSLAVTGLAPSTGNSISYQGTGLTPRLGIGTPNITSGEVYYSLAFQLSNLGTVTPTGVFIAGFNNTPGTQTGQPTQVGTRLLVRTGFLANTFNVGVEKNSGTAANFVFDTTDRPLNETIFVVGRYTLGPNVGDDFSDMWINPDPSTFGAASPPVPNLTTTTAGGDLPSGVGTFLFRQGNANVPFVVADELRVDTTWAAVTVPEPSAIALSVVALLLFGGAWRRRALRGGLRADCS